MAHVDDSGITELDRITIAAVVRVAGWGLLGVAEAGLLIDRLRAHHPGSDHPGHELPDRGETP